MSGKHFPWLISLFVIMQCKNQKPLERYFSNCDVTLKKLNKRTIKCVPASARLIQSFKIDSHGTERNPNQVKTLIEKEKIKDRRIMDKFGKRSELL